MRKMQSLTRQQTVVCCAIW